MPFKCGGSFFHFHKYVRKQKEIATDSGIPGTGFRAIDVSWSWFAIPPCAWIMYAFCANEIEFTSDTCVRRVQAWMP